MEARMARPQMGARPRPAASVKPAPAPIFSANRMTCNRRKIHQNCGQEDRGKEPVNSARVPGSGRGHEAGWPKAPAVTRHALHLALSRLFIRPKNNKQPPDPFGPAAFFVPRRMH